MEDDFIESPDTGEVKAADQSAALEKQRIKLEELREELSKSKKLAVEMALEHQAVFSDSSLVNAYFSTQNSTKKYQIASEGILEKGKELLTKAIDLLWAMIKKVYKWFQKLFNFGDKPITEEAVSRAQTRFKEAGSAIEKAERIPSVRTAIGIAVRDDKIDDIWMAKFLPEEIDVYNDGKYNAAMQQLIPVLNSLDVLQNINIISRWYDKAFERAAKFDAEHANLDDELLEQRLETFKQDSIRDLDYHMQIAAKMKENAWELYQKAVEAQRQLKADPNFLLGHDLSGLIAKGERVFERCGYQVATKNLTDLYRDMVKASDVADALKKTSEERTYDRPYEPGAKHLAESFVQNLLMKHVNNIISTFNQMVQTIQLLNHYYTYVIGLSRKILGYSEALARAALKHGGDKEGLNLILQACGQVQQKLPTEEEVGQ